MVYTRASVGKPITASQYNEHADELRLYRWVDGFARGNQTGMVKGEFGYQADVDATYRYSGSAWVPWEVSRRSWTPATTAGLDLTKGTLTCQYSIAGQVVSYWVRGLASAAAFVTGSVTFTYPVLDGTDLTPTQANTTGVVYFIESVDGGRFFGPTIHGSTALNPGVVNTAGTYAALNGLSGTVPFSWDVDDQFVCNGSYHIA